MASDERPSPPPDLLVLDTHVFLWLIDETDELAGDTLERIDRAAASGRVFVSVIAVWEIAMLVRKNRLDLASPVHEWVARALSHPGLDVHPLTPEIAVDGNQLPGTIHGDPADRIMIATSRTLDATLITRDRLILAYGAQGYVDVLAA